MPGQLNDYKIRVSHCKTKWEVTINNEGLGDSKVSKPEYKHVRIECDSESYAERSKDGKKVHFWWHVKNATHKVIHETIIICKHN